MLDERLSLAFRLYPNCDLAADIGTDHAYLPSELLRKNRCSRMILTDISQSALNNARQEMIRHHLIDRVDFRCGDGLHIIHENCQAISILGMGGQTINRILYNGKRNLANAPLILSAHTDIHLVRRAIVDLNYHIDFEEPCFSHGRFYLLIRACPGTETLSPQQIRIGKKLFESESPVTAAYIRRREDVLLSKKNGLLRATDPDDPLLRQISEDINVYHHYLEDLS